MMRSLLKILFVLLLPFQLHAFNTSNDLYALTNESPAVTGSTGLLYAHIDKTIYSVNEMVWFTAYLRSEDQYRDKTEFLQVLLVDDQRQIILTQKIAMKAGIASGNILLPDSLKSGKFNLLLYTNTVVKGQPYATFTQTLIIKGADPLPPLAGSVKAKAGEPPSFSNPVITMNKAVADDTLELSLKNSRLEKYHLVIHNQHDIFASLPVVLNQHERKVKIALNDLPRGIAGITLLDSAKRVCNKRIFFAHYKQRNHLSIETSDSVYKKRQMVKLTLKLADWKGSAQSGKLSVSCVQSNRLPPSLMRNIETYSFWQSPLKDWDNKYAAQNVDELEKTLSLSDWKQEDWKLLLDKDPDSAISYDIAGKVTRFGKMLKKPVTLIMMKDSSMHMITTDSLGHFVLSPEDLFQVLRKDIRLMVSGKSPQDYQINIDDPYEALNKSLAVNISNDENWNLPNAEVIDLGNSMSPGVNQLKEVKIVSRRDMTFYGTRKRENACGDYICKYGFLNCPVHIADLENEAPVKGNRYKIYLGPNADGSDIISMMIYLGCQPQVYENSKMISGIQKAVDFIPVNFDSESSSIPELSSTLLWVNNIDVSSSGTAQLSFYTNDLKGRFKILVQGLAGDNVVSGEKIITVE